MPSSLKLYATSWNICILTSYQSCITVLVFGMPNMIRPHKPSCMPCTLKSGNGLLIFSVQGMQDGLNAKEWQRVADLIESKSLPLLTLSWGASQHTLVRLRHWLVPLPVNILSSPPRPCL